jgi:hypothetical protein
MDSILAKSPRQNKAAIQLFERQTDHFQMLIASISVLSCPVWLNSDYKIWKSKELAHSHPTRDRPIGLPARCALIR